MIVREGLGSRGFKGRVAIPAVGTDELFAPPPGAGHPMKPHRLALTHSLVLHYGLYKKMIVSFVASAGIWGRERAAALGIGGLDCMHQVPPAPRGGEGG
jgi:hypothetical protein